MNTGTIPLAGLEMRRTRRLEQWTARHEAEIAQLREESLPDGSGAQRLRRRKIRVVAAVRAGMLSLNQAIERFNLTLGQFYEWEREVGAEVARNRQKSRQTKATTAAHARLIQENRTLIAENRRLHEQLKLLRMQLSRPRRNDRKKGRSNADRSPE